MAYTYEQFESAILKMTTIDLTAYKEKQMKRRIDTLIGKNRVTSYDAYVNLIKTNKEKFEELRKDNRIWFGPEGNNVPAVKRFLSEVKQGMTALTIWPYTEVDHNDAAKKEVVAFNSEDVFPTPKPEKLIQRVLHLASNPGDLVLDSFLGSGTTAAVAHKMGRRWIGIEMGDHVYTHCIPRLQKVIKGEDAGGVTKSTGWLCGGSFKFYELASSLIVKEIGREHV